MYSSRCLANVKKKAAGSDDRNADTFAAQSKPQAATEEDVVEVRYRVYNGLQVEEVLGMNVGSCRFPEAKVRYEDGTVECVPVSVLSKHQPKVRFCRDTWNR